MRSQLAPHLAQELARALEGLAFGSVHVVVHDSQVVRIERIERVRLTVSAEAETTAGGRPTEPSEVRHGEHEEL